MKSIAIFASGGGSNAEKIIKYFKGYNSVKLGIIVSNQPNAYVLERAKQHGIETLVLEKKWQENANQLCLDLKEKGIELIVLAGFLQLIPEEMIVHFPKKIINIHPALLPKYGGKGMYGMHVHRAVKAAGEKESGITIHYVDENYDEGEVLLQAKCVIEEQDSAEEIQKKVLALEHKHFAPCIESVLLKK